MSSLIIYIISFLFILMNYNLYIFILSLQNVGKVKLKKERKVLKVQKKELALENKRFLFIL